MSQLLEVNNIVTKFYTEDGIVHAVSGISYTLAEGEAMAIVGESGSVKSVGVLSIMGLIPSPPGQVEAGSIIFNGRDLLQLSDEEKAKVTELRAKGEELHEAGNHAESVATLAEAKKILGIE